jgi:hypothetical protein
MKVARDIGETKQYSATTMVVVSNATNIGRNKMMAIVAWCLYLP